ncbi:DnaJ domain-containing protein [Ilumatobacter sp.]|uniref:DnaJ domain-containing protein n=1 Tax=Ilumatobacter sp. TaxID=1967498 RepID=UPI003B516B22
MPSGPDRRNLYRVLHVQPDAPPAVLKSSYRALMLSMEMHPDRGGDHWSAARINDAYAVLSDPVARADYDRTLVASPSAADARGAAGRAQPTPSAPIGADGCAPDDDTCCVFCGARSRGTADPSSASCSVCRSPLGLADAPQVVADGRRIARRVERDGAIRFFERWPSPPPGVGRILDLSPNGLRFEADRPIGEFRILKLAGPLLDAVARVASVTEHGGSSAIGVEFYTVRFHHDRGTFLSTTA